MALNEGLLASPGNIRCFYKLGERLEDGVRIAAELAADSPGLLAAILALGPKDAVRRDDIRCWDILHPTKEFLSIFRKAVLPSGRPQQGIHRQEHAEYADFDSLEGPWPIYDRIDD